MQGQEQRCRVRKGNGVSLAGGELIKVIELEGEFGFFVAFRVGLIMTLRFYIWNLDWGWEGDRNGR